MYQMYVLPTPTSNSMDKIKKIHKYKFIWNSKRDKLKRKVMNLNCKISGYKIIGITEQNMALKLIWILDIFELLIVSGCNV